MKKKNKKGFTLIELLVVVAIIGILASVGVVAYNGYTSSAQRSAAESNHNSVAKWVANEYQKCSIGDDFAMDNNLDCVDDSNLPATPAQVATATINSQTAATSNMNNPYTKVNAVQSAAGTVADACTSAIAGQIFISSQEADATASPPVPAAIIVGSCASATATPVTTTVALN